MIEITEVNAKGEFVNVTMEELKERHKRKYFSWLKEVGELAGWTEEETAAHVNDINFFGCFDDGMSAEATVAEATVAEAKKDGAI
jgi:hypothetical protein